MQLTKKKVTNLRTEEVYKRSLRFTKEIYKIIKRFPNYEEKNLRDQLRRASSSISANIAEGHCNIYFGKERDRLNSSLGSAAECQSFLDLACMIDYITKEEYKKLNGDAQRILDMLITKIEELTEIIEKGEVA